MFTWASLHAQIDSTNSKTLDSLTTGVVQADTVTVTAGLTQLSQALTPFSTAVMRPADLKALPIRASTDVLAYVPGVDLRQRGPIGIQADVSIRGGTFEQTAVMLDGLRLNDIQTGHHTLNLPILPDNIERIEVLKGGSARFFGAGALDGAVNIVLKNNLDEPSLNVSLVGGDASLMEGRLSATAGIGPVGNLISIQAMKTDGWVHNTDAELQSALYRASMPVGDGTAALTIAANHKVFGANGYYTPNFPEQWEEIYTYLGAASIEVPLSEQFEIQIRALGRINEDEFRLKRDDPSFYTNTHKTQAYLGQAGLRWHQTNGTTSVLFEGGHDDIESSNLGLHNRLRGNIMLEHVQNINNFRVSAGAGVISFSDRAPLIAGGVEASVHFEPLPTTIDLIYASAQRSGRIPTYTDLYYSDPVTNGDSTLVPEYAYTFEGGFRRTAENYGFQLAVYRRDGHEMIDYIVDPITGAAQAANISNVGITGVDVSGTISFENIVLSSVRIGFVYQDVQTSATQKTRYVADNLRTQGIIDTRWLLPLDIEASYIFRVIERVTDPTVHLIHDVRIQRQFGVITPMIELTNISSESYIETGWVVVPPRWFRAGVSLSL